VWHINQGPKALHTGQVERSAGEGLKLWAGLCQAHDGLTTQDSCCLTNVVLAAKAEGHKALLLLLPPPKAMHNCLHLFRFDWDSSATDHARCKEAEKAEGTRAEGTLSWLAVTDLVNGQSQARMTASCQHTKCLASARGKLCSDQAELLEVLAVGQHGQTAWLY
jgi:hypothetical protein